jgi:hypothetical protein
VNWIQYYNGDGLQIWSNHIPDAGTYTVAYTIKLDNDYTYGTGLDTVPNTAPVSEITYDFEVELVDPCVTA